MVSVVCIGDSITYGQGGSVSFPTRIGTLTGYSVTNKGIQGNTTTQMLARFATDVVAYNPDYVIILGGQNDINASTPAATIESNLEDMCEAANAAGITPILCQILPCSNHDAAQNAIRDAENAWISNYGLSIGRATIDLFTPLGEPGSPYTLNVTMTSDGSHPNDVGYALISTLIYTGVFESMEEQLNVTGSPPHLDRGNLDRTALDRGDASCHICCNMTDTFTVSGTIIDPTFACNMTDTFEVRSSITINYISINTLIRSAEVRRSAAHPYWTAKLTFDKGTTGGSTSSLFFNSTPVALSMMDYTNAPRTVFVGVIPSEQRRHNSWASQEEFTAYSFAWYLSKQYLPVIANTRLYVNSLIDLVYFDNSAINPAESVYIYPDTYINGLLGCNINWYGALPFPALEGQAYVDDTDEYWRRTTNLYPTKITAVSTSGTYTAPPIVAMYFSTTTTKQQAIDELNKYYSYVFYDKWYYDTTTAKWQPSAYWVPYVDIDSAGAGLDLPTKATLTQGSTTTSNLYPYLAGEIEVDQKGDEKYNFVTVRSAGNGASWMEHVNIDPDTFHPVYNPSTTITTYELPIEYYEENQDILTSTDLEIYSDALYACYSNQVITYRCRFRSRSDLELYQLVAVSGFDNSTYGIIEDGDYRIIEITYRLDNAAQENEVEVVLMLADKFTSYFNLKRPFVNTIMEIQKIIKDATARAQQTNIGYMWFGSTSVGGAPVGIQDMYVCQSVASSYYSRKSVYCLSGGPWSTATQWLITQGANGRLYGTKYSTST